MGNIRVVIVDDSSLARGLLRTFLEDEAGIEVVGEAMNGRQAVELARELKPDLMTMDLEMPVMGGIEAIEEIMYTKAVPILVVSSHADAEKALEAVNRGALEVIGKPDYSPSQAAEFVAKVRLLAGVTVITRMRPKAPRLPDTAASAPQPAAPVEPRLEPVVDALAQPYQMVFAIASSTGGPQALVDILTRLPGDFPAPVLISQHISEGFAAGMAEWLDKLCPLPVRLGREGEAIQAGTIYVSPSERHMAVTAARYLTLQERGEHDLYHPSCDVLLRSVGQVFGRRAVGIILTGMGHDGVEGLKAILASGGRTLAQDEASSVVFGMNRVATEQGAAQRILPVDRIAAEMVALAGGNAGERP